MRALGPHFEPHLFLSATPHNGYTESFTDEGDEPPASKAGDCRVDFGHIAAPAVEGDEPALADLRDQAFYDDSRVSAKSTVATRTPSTNSSTYGS